ncbi:MAG: ATP-binding protein [Muribaculaceae bacterium]|nr:ATP-binding protein [Muribaculaceae bacterium]
MINEKKEIKYPIGIQSFSEIREGGYLYVDKTAFIHKLAQGKYYFLSRPRRFGKSLLLSTLEAYYQGRRDLFKGLAIDSLTEEWEVHPILHLDLNNGTYTKPGDLDVLLDYHLKEWEKKYDISREDDSPGMTVSLRFSRVIKSAFEKSGKKVVILVDEYDKPLLNAFSDPERADLYRIQLKAFYSNLKTMDAYIKIGILTGVARFSKVSIFSDLNNLRDISYEDQFSAICGVTSDELKIYFKDSIEILAEKLNISSEETKEKLQLNYDGYHFSAESPDIYNPFSLLNAFAKGSIGTYWSESATPEFLVTLLQNEDWNLSELVPCQIDNSELETSGIMSENPIPVLYQTGYFTIKNYDPLFQLYTLDYPNEEVKRGFWKFLIPYYLYSKRNKSPFNIRLFIDEVQKGDAESFMTRMETLIAGVPYSEKGSAESHFQNAVYLLFNLMGFYCRMEERTSNGRIDITVETDRYVFIIEFKVDSSSQAAMDQIEEKKYWLPYQLSGKQIILIGANFDTKSRRLSPAPLIKYPEIS